MTTPSPRENAERAVELRSLVEATGLPDNEVAALLNMTKSSLSHKMAARRTVDPSELALVREELASMNPVTFMVEISNGHVRVPHTVSAVSVTAALRSLAASLEGRDTPNLESPPPS